MKRVVDSIVVFHDEHACLGRHTDPDRVVESEDIVADLEPSGLWDDYLLNSNSIHSSHFNCITHEVTLLDYQHNCARCRGREQTEVVVVAQMFVKVGDTLRSARVDSRENSIIDLLDKLGGQAGKALDEETGWIIAVNNHLFPTCALTELIQYVTLEHLRVLDTFKCPIVNTRRHECPFYLVSEEISSKRYQDPSAPCSLNRRQLEC